MSEFEKNFTREEVIKSPIMMGLIQYLHKTHDLPKYGWQNKNLRYHYTDAAGLLGIVQNGRLWATDLRFLNDPSEGSYFLERILDIMASKNGGISDTEKEIINGIRSSLHKRSSDSTPFCVSLSANGDLLSQWRGYGSFGKGYAIGLNFKDMLPHPQIAGYYDINYGEEGLEDLAIDLLDLFVSAFDKWNGIMYEEWASTLSHLAKSFKNPSYSEEKESRLVCNYSSDDKELFEKELPLSFRTNGGDLIPYIPMSLGLLEGTDQPRLPIERIIVGPGVDFERNHASIETLLKTYSYNDVKIKKSIIPFRS